MSIPDMLRTWLTSIDLFLTISVLVYAVRNCAALKCAHNMDMYIYHAFNIIIFSTAVEAIAIGSHMLIGTAAMHSAWLSISNISQSGIYFYVLRCVRTDWMNCRACCPKAAKAGCGRS